jgi:hypothetical protein
MLETSILGEAYAIAAEHYKAIDDARRLLADEISAGAAP